MLPLYDYIHQLYPLNLYSLVTTSLFSISIDCCMTGIMQYIIFWNYLFFYSVKYPWDPSKLLHTLVVHYFLLPHSIPYYWCTTVCLTICPFGHLFPFFFLVITNKSTMSNCVQVFVWICFHFSGINTQGWS